MFFYGCKKDSPISSENPTNGTKKLKISDFSDYGVIHNEFLTNIKHNFKTNLDLIDEKSKIEYINTYNVQYAKVNDFKIVGRESLISALNEKKNYINKLNIVDEMFYNKTKGTDSLNIFFQIQEISKRNVISPFGANLLENISLQIKNNYEGLVSDILFKENIASLVNEYNSHNYLPDSEEGIIIGKVLSITLYSIEWWEQNPDIFKGEKIAPWVIADAAGALGGAIGSIADNLFNGESVNWASAGAWALGGAVGGSSGVWIAKLLAK